MNRIFAGVLALTVVCLTLLGVLVGRGGATGDGPRMLLPSVFGYESSTGGHETITEYTGPETCLTCHLKQADQMHGSAHYQLDGPTPNVPNIIGNAGKGNGGMNTYCGAISTSSDFTCAGCHVGNGQKATDKPTREQLANIDCLMCHQVNYARKADGPYEQLEAIGQDGQPRTILVPIEDENGFHFTPDTSKMTISLVEAARTAGPTTRATCLRCHAGAGGGDGSKRGDISSADVNPSVTHDFHMSPQSENMTCSECHDAGNHRMLGRGLDLRQNDVAQSLTCEKCHGARPHKDYDPRNGRSLDAHTGRVACQTCHIPVFGKDVDTELARDWTQPVWFAGIFGGQGGWKPEETRASNIIPTYKWFDLTSNVYQLGQSPKRNADGQYVFAEPLGSVSSTGAKIYPMKEHTSISARHNATGQIIPHSTEVYFRTGDFAQAIQAGAEQVGLTGSYTIVPLHTFQTINHGVEPSANALDCLQCHASVSLEEDDRAADALRMDLVGELGYGLKGPQQSVCTQCHGPETPEGFGKTHEEHVWKKGFDCSHCHTFSRPERGLRLP